MVEDKSEMTQFSLGDLADIVAKRAASGDSENSYTARLLAAGVGKCAKKFGEEAVEAALAAVSESREALASEAGDVLYHLMVLLAAREVTLDQVMAGLEKRTAQSGLSEKAGRQAGPGAKT